MHSCEMKMHSCQVGAAKEQFTQQNLIKEREGGFVCVFPKSIRVLDQNLIKQM